MDIAGYLHMCRTAYDAAPKFTYPDFISDLYVVGQAKFDSCGLAKKDFPIKMKKGDPYPDFMRYHPEEMGFGGPFVRFEWSDKGWIMCFWARYLTDRDKNMTKKRFLA